ncbi:unnamed protein product [Lasius platythorax]|uniref:Reverse transcriptase domain-containing protein n=1 Tax=Lasius platythorax TaxID=488582 RepID=A0AAV2NND3_9HYME
MGVTIRIANPGIKTGHCPPLKGPEGVCSGDCLVTCINDKAYIRFINTLDHEVEIAIPIITLNEISQVAQKPPQYKNNYELRNTQITGNPLSANPAKTYTVLPEKENKEQLVNSLQANKDQNIQNQLKDNVEKSKENTSKPHDENLYNNNIESFTQQISNTLIIGQEHCLPSGASRCVVDQDRHPFPKPPSFHTANTYNKYTITSAHVNPNSKHITIKNTIFTSVGDCKSLSVNESTNLALVRCPYQELQSGINSPPVTDDAALAPVQFPYYLDPSGQNSSSPIKSYPASADELETCVDTKKSTDDKVESINTINTVRNEICENNYKSSENQLNKNYTEDRISEILRLLRLDHLDILEKNSVIDIVVRHSDRFYIPGEYLGKTNVINHKIITADETPVHIKQYRFPPVHREEINKQVSELLQKDIVIPSTSPYNSPVWIVPKKADSLKNKKWRMVIDYRRLNEKTTGDAYPLPNISDILDQLGGAKYFSVLDLASGFHQIPIDPKDAHKTAFSTCV